MPRYRLTLAYDGTRFHGWQKQYATEQQLAGTGFSGVLLTPGGAPDAEGRVQLRTVQGVVEERLRRVCREPVVLQGSSRTDAGVHAAAQVAAFSRASDAAGPPPERLLDALNAGLPEDVVGVECEEVPESFDPIADCARKGYRYTIAAGRPRPLWARRYVSSARMGVDVGMMRAVGAVLVGTHDFAAFTNVGAERESTVRTVLSCDVAESDGLVCLDVSGDGFLYNMVRIIAGTLVEAGRGRIDEARVREALRTGDRRLAGPTLGPEGLRLEWMEHVIGGAVVRAPGEGALRLR